METSVTAGGDKIWAEDSGGPGPVVVLAHSGVGDARQWDPLWPALTSECRVIRFDVQGFGRSAPATGDYTYGGDLRQVLDHFAVPSAHLAGCSMGGNAALWLALADPGRVRSLTLLCPGLSDYPWPDEPELDAAYEAVVATGDSEALLRFSQRVFAAAGDEPVIMEQLRSAQRAEPNEEEFRRPDVPVFGRLAELDAPATLLVGDLDRPPLIACNEEIARRIPGCRLVLMPGVDHLPTLREPALIAAAILGQVRAAETG